MKKKIAFIILHYKNLKDTVECMESIKQLDNTEEAAMIVVDNHSLDKDGIKKIKEYTKDLVLLDNNLGYAKGNNEGCKYAIEKYHPEYLCVINNDIILNQKDFIKEIETCYQSVKFDIMGPKIITDGGESVNPFPVYSTLEEVQQRIAYHKKLIQIYQNSFLRFLLYLYTSGKRLFQKPIHMVNGEHSEKDIALHGCAIIFSKKYYEKYEHVFYNETFLYHEEEFLNYRKNRDHLISYYDANLEVFHKEGASLNENFKNRNYEKLIFRNKEIIKSLSLLEEAIKNNKEI